MLSELSESWCCLLFLGSDGELIDVCVKLITSLTSQLLLHDLHFYLSGWDVP